MRRPARRFPLSRAFGYIFLDSTSRTKQVCVEVVREELFQEFLSFRPDTDDAGLAAPFRLVVGRLVEPHAPARVDVRPPQVACFPWSAPGQSLELDQPADVSREEGKRGIDHSIIDRLYWFSFAGSRPAFLESADGCD